METERGREEKRGGKEEGIREVGWQGRGRAVGGKRQG